MTDPRTDDADTAQTIGNTPSHRSPSKPRPKNARPDGANRVAIPAQNQLDPGAEVPLHVRPVLNGYSEVVALGICSERSLRRHIATGRVRRSVIRNGRNLRFVVATLIDELRGVED
jgi:hypothetical protein